MDDNSHSLNTGGLLSSLHNTTSLLVAKFFCSEQLIVPVIARYLISPKHQYLSSLFYLRTLLYISIQSLLSYTPTLTHLSELQSRYTLSALDCSNSRKMGRIKCPPRMGRAHPQPQHTPTPSGLTSSENNQNQASSSKTSVMGDFKIITKSISSKLSVVDDRTRPENFTSAPPSTIDKPVQMEPSSTIFRPSSAKVQHPFSKFKCPQCCSPFPGMGIKVSHMTLIFY